LQLLTSNKPLSQSVGMSAVSRITGSVDEVFNQIDTSKDGTIDATELAQLLTKLGVKAAESELHTLFQTIDLNHSGLIEYHEFQIWYLASEHRLLQDLESAFLDCDTNGDQEIDLHEMKKLLVRMSCNLTEADMIEAFNKMDGDGDGFVNKEEFLDWFQHTEFWDAQKLQAETAAEAATGPSLNCPKDASLTTHLVFLATWPLVFMVTFTLPNVRLPGNASLCLLTFLGSIFWLGIFSYIMVECATIAGDTLGIPSAVMGLTVLAAGTSVPDLLSRCPDGIEWVSQILIFVFWHLI